MRIVNAIWEKRNLGVNVQEFYLCDDDYEKLEDELLKLDAPYQVAKVVGGSFRVLEELQKRGFLYIEDQITMCHLLNDVYRTAIHQRMQESVGFRLMNDRDFEEMLYEVDQGMFDTDRIALDERFGMEISAKRYHNWICDLNEQGIRPYAFVYKDRVCAFVILRPKESGVFQSVLGGFYKEFRGTGLGVVQKEMDIVKSLHGKRIVSSVSSNNILQMRAMCLNGYIPSETDHVLIRHLN